VLQQLPLLLQLTGPHPVLQQLPLLRQLTGPHPVLQQLPLLRQLEMGLETHDAVAASRESTVECTAAGCLNDCTSFCQG
jgi:hypothetical protein